MMKNKNKIWLFILAVTALILCPVTVWGQSLPANPGLYKQSGGQYIHITGVAANDVAAAAARVNLAGAANDGAYTLAINQNVTLPANQTVNRANRQLTIIGIGQERIITASAGGAFIFSNTGSTGAPSLTLGENITIKGAGSYSTGDLIQMRAGTSLIMKAGSKITGYSSNGQFFPVNLSGNAANITTFIMDGGEISGNKVTVRNTNGSAGVFVSAHSTFTMNGGTITGNTITDTISETAAISRGSGGVSTGSNDRITFIMNGGTITGNTRNNAPKDVQISNYAGVTFTYSAGAIGALFDKKNTSVSKP